MGDVALTDMKGALAEIIAAGGDVIVIPLSAVAADAVFEDGYATVFVAGGTGILDDAANTERTTGGWNRKVIVNANITLTSDDTANLRRVILDADSLWTSVAASNDVVALLIAEDAATDALRRVIGSWAFVVTTDGNDVTANYDQTLGIATYA